jgi:hypothetical protein
MDFDAFRHAVEHDPEVAFRLGCQILAMPDHASRSHADRAFELAVAQSGPDMLWRVVDAYVVAFDPRAETWHSRAVAAESDPDGIAVDPGTLGIHTADGVPHHQNWEICVRSDEPARAVTALEAAIPRLMCTLEDGREVSADELMAQRGDTYSPNYAAVDESVPLVWMDCKGEIIPPMARTMIRIVVNELRSAGFERALLYSRTTTDRPASVEAST